MQVPFFALRDFPSGLEAAVEEGLLQALRQKQYVLGPQVAAFETAFARYLQVPHCVGVANGYDALVLALRVLGIGPGDEVLVPANAYVAAVNAVVAAGAVPVFAEPDPATFNLSAENLAPLLTPRTKALLPVHLFGQAADMTRLMAFAEAYRLQVVEDCAQAHGATHAGRHCGTFGQANAFSFYPTKNLGAAGDAGAVTTASEDAARQLRLLRHYGQQTRYVNEVIGVNSRLDELQAAVLLQKLPHLEAQVAERRRLAAVYRQQLSHLPDLTLPKEAPGNRHAYHLYVVRTQKREALAQHLAQAGVQTYVHYPVPPYLQPAYRHLQLPAGSFPITEELATTSLSLPLFPGMTEAEQQYAIEQVGAFFRK